MLSTKVFKSSSNAKEYYSHADYYGVEAKGIWFGSGLKDFNLMGEFDAKTDQGFKDILNGKMRDGRLLGNLEQDGSIKHRPGVDLTFSSPKSISIQMHVLGSQEEKIALQDARMKALKTTLKYIEESRMVYTRKGAQGIIQEKVDTLVFSLFEHTTNRKLEPQDHVHCLLANVVKCRDGKFRTIVWDEVLRNNKLIGQVFRNELAIEVQKLGYDIRTTLLSDGSSSFELINVSQDLIDAFSTRRKEIVELFKQYNVTTKEGKDRIVINSRESKKILSEYELKESWNAIAKAVKDEERDKTGPVINNNDTNDKIKLSVQGNKLNKAEESKLDNSFDFKSSLKAKYSEVKEVVLDKIRDVLDKTIYKDEVQKLERPTVELTIDQISKLALIDSTYTQSVFTKEDILRSALKHSIGKYSVKETEQGVKNLIQSKEIIKSNTGEARGLFTSKELINKERCILRIVKSGIGKSKAIVDPENFKKRFEYHEKHLTQSIDKATPNINFTLNKQQVKAVKHVLCSKDKIIAIEGLPGVGKSSVLERVRDMSRNKIVHIGTSPTASAAKNLEESSGIESRTLHSFTGKYRGYIEGRGTEQGLLKTKNEFKQTFIFVDEASLMGTKQMYDLLKLSEILKFRVVLIGDTKQLSGVEAGKPFEQILDIIKPVKLTQIIRQKNREHIKAIERAADNNLLKSFKIHEENIQDSQQFASQAVKKYLSLTTKERDKTLLISPSREDRDKVNQLIVKSLTDKGVLSGSTTYILETLKDTDMTKTDYSFARNYKQGYIIRFNKNYKASSIKKR